MIDRQWQGLLDVTRFAYFEPELLDADDWKLAVEYDDSGLPVKILLLFNICDL